MKATVVMQAKAEHGQPVSWQRKLSASHAEREVHLVK